MAGNDSITLTGSTALRGGNVVIEGGDGGFDVLVIESGGYASIVSAPTGPDSGSIVLDGAAIRYAGFEPVLVGGLAKGKYLLPGTPLAEEHTPAEIRRIAAGLP